MRSFRFNPLIQVGAVAALSASAAPAQQAAERAAPPIIVSAKYVVDTTYVSKGADSDRTFLVHNAQLTADLDMDRLVGARGLTAGVELLGTGGAQPNTAAGTLQGIDNIEAASHRVKLYEAWLEQAFAHGRGSVRLGLTDLNADFYQNESAGLLTAPAFGVGSELAATGPNGPSIFPSTALTARVAVRLGHSGYAKFAIVDAKAGVIGDPDGVDVSMREGALIIAEVGLAGSAKFALGVWRYSKKQDDIHAIEPDGRPVRRVANGAYLLADRRIAGDDAHAASLFLRIGCSDGETTPFRGGFQAGISIAAPIPGRPHGQLSLGVEEGLLSRGFRRVLEDDGYRSRAAEYGLELTYSDQLLPWLSVQPDFQYIRRAYGDDNRRGTIIFGARISVTRG